MVADAVLSQQRKTDREPKAMSQEAAPRLSHVGLYVHDVPKMIDFYTERPRLCGQRRGGGRPHHVSVAATPATITRSCWCAAAPPIPKRRWCSRCRSMSARSPMSSAPSARCATPAARASARSATAMPGRCISRTPKATASRCSATRRGTCRSHCGFKIDLDKSRGRAVPRDRGLLPGPRGVQADRGVAGRDQQENRGASSKHKAGRPSAPCSARHAT